MEPAMPAVRHILAGLVTAAVVWMLAAWPALAQDRCLAFAQAPASGLVMKAQFAVKPPQQGPTRITFIGHATFLIESPKGIKVATDYNDYVRPSIIPDIATMNRAHDTHFSYHPDPAIGHILRGWNPAGGPVEHDITVGDVRVRNVPTNIRDWSGGTAEYGNSIFVFEIGDLCVAHLGHLHHTLTVQQLGALGQMDVLLVPVDGSYTIDLDGMMEVLQTLKPRIIIPMHFFSTFGLSRFLDRARQVFEVVENPVPTITISKSSLPDHQQVLVLPGR
jgi:L-ascorbate metabolism protein UlaG (beta-lactamase superfamily)